MHTCVCIAGSGVSYQEEEVVWSPLHHGYQSRCGQVQEQHHYRGAKWVDPVQIQEHESFAGLQQN